MDPEQAIAAAMKSLAIPYARMLYTGKADEFATYQIIACQEQEHGDDECQVENWLYRVDVFCRGSPVALIRKVKAALRANGFVGVYVDPEVYEEDTHYYHVPVEARYYMEV